MALIYPREWSYPNVDDTDGLLQWARDHHREHMELEARRIEELAEFDHYKYMVAVHLSATQENLTNNTWTTVELDNEDIDSGSRFNTTTHQFTAPMSRRYCIAGSIAFLNCVANTWYAGRIRLIDSKTLAYNNAFTDGNADVAVSMSRMVDLDEGDVLELQALSNSGDNTVDIYGNDAAIYTYFTAYVVG